MSGADAGAIYLREETIRDAGNEWFAELFHRDHVDETVAAPVASQDGAGRIVTGRDAAAQQLAKAEAEINNTPAPNLMEAAEVYARIDTLGDVPATLSRGAEEGLAELYAGTDLQVETFRQAHLLRRSRGPGGMRGRSKLERNTFTTTRPYRLRGRFRCALCERKMNAARSASPSTTGAWRGRWRLARPYLQITPGQSTCAKTA